VGGVLQDGAVLAVRVPAISGDATATERRAIEAALRALRP